MAMTFGLEGFNAQSELDMEDIGQENFDLDMTEEAEALNVATTEYFQNVSNFENMETLSACAISNEAIMALVPFMAQDADASLYFGLDNPNPAFIRTQLDAATEGMLGDFIRGSIPFIGVYLDSVRRLVALIAKDKYKVGTMANTSDDKFATIKAYHLDLKEHFFEKGKTLHHLMGNLQNSAKNITKLNVAGLNQSLEGLGLKINLTKAVAAGAGVAAAGGLGYALVVNNMSYVNVIAAAGQKVGVSREATLGGINSVKNAATTATGAVQGAVNTATGAVKGAVDAVTGKLDSTVGSFARLAMANKTVTGKALTGVQNAAGAVKGAATTATGAVKGAALTAAEATKNAAITAAGAVKNGAVAAGEFAATQGAKIPGAVAAVNGVKTGAQVAGTYAAEKGASALAFVNGKIPQAGWDYLNKAKSFLKPLANVKLLASGFVAGQVVSGGVTALIGAMQKIFSQSVYVKGWEKKDVVPALNTVAQLLQAQGQVKAFSSDLKANFASAYAAASDASAKAQIKANYKILVQIAPLYTSNVVQMARGVHEMCERVS